MAVGMAEMSEYAGARFLVLFCWFLLAAVVVGICVLIILGIVALIKYVRRADVRKEKKIVKKSLGETLQSYRTQNKMTQEFVAERIGVSRQAVSKWENGTADPNTSNLFALAKLYQVSVEELLRSVESSKTADSGDK